MTLAYKLSKFISKHQNQELTLDDIKHFTGCNTRVAKNALKYLLDSFGDKVTYTKNGKKKTYRFTGIITPEEIEPWVKPYSEASKESRIKKQSEILVIKKRLDVLEGKINNEYLNNNSNIKD